MLDEKKMEVLSLVNASLKMIKKRDGFGCVDSNKFWNLTIGDCVQSMKQLEPASVDAIVTDPPYGLEFMGKEWDRFSGDIADRDFKGFVLPQQRTRNVKCPECGKWAYDHPGRLCECGGIRRAQTNAFQQWCEGWAVEALRVLKPGGHLLAFGGTRTFHRLACALEDAGFEIRDCIMYIYGSGFPKSLNVAQAMDKVARGSPQGGPDPLKRGTGSVPERIALGHGGATGRSQSGITSDCEAYVPETEEAKRWYGWGTALKPSYEPILVCRKPLIGTVVANVLRHGTGALNIDASRIAIADWDARAMERVNSPGSGHLRGRDPIQASRGLKGKDEAAKPLDTTKGRWPANICHDGSEEVVGLFPITTSNDPGTTHVKANGWGHSAERRNRGYAGDSGSAARFFYCAKASRKDRGEGNDHPTVKPTALMRWLVRLVTPPGGLILDPFCGSGSTGKAAVLECFNFIGIEKDEKYADIAAKRIEECADGYSRKIGVPID